MRFGIAPAQHGFAHSGLTVLLASPDTLLVLDLERIFTAMGLRVHPVADGSAAIDALESLEDGSIVLLDVRLPWVANGRLLAAMHELGIHKRCAIALIAEQVSDEWIARLREGVVDDIVPRNAGSAIWNKHLSTMQRGHQLFCELENLRAASLAEVQHDPLTGVFNRETMMTLLFRETDRVQRLRGALSLVALDIDDFSHWNQELGREACDTLLREVSTRVGRLLRSYDLLGRTGPDEFLLALPGCSPINASMLAERLRMEVFGEPFSARSATGEALQVNLTACFGITTSRGRSPVVVAREAEQALANARKFGPGATRSASESSGETARAAHLFPETGILV